jgi:hypothetical protein
VKSIALLIGNLPRLKEGRSGYGGPLVVSNENSPVRRETDLLYPTEANRPSSAHWGLALVILGFVLKLPAAMLSVFLWNQ